MRGLNRHSVFELHLEGRKGWLVQFSPYFPFPPHLSPTSGAAAIPQPRGDVSTAGPATPQGQLGVQRQMLQMGLDR